MDYGLLRVNWAKRDLQVSGIAGDSDNQMTYNEVKAALAEHQNHPEPDTEVWGLIAWERCESSDGLQQLCLVGLDTLRESAGIYEDDDPDDDHEPEDDDV